MISVVGDKTKHTQYAFRISWKSVLDHSIFALVLILAVIPMSRIPWLGGGRGINIQVPLEVFIAIALVARLVMVGAAGKPLPLLLFTFVLVVYSGFSLVFLDMPLSDVLFHIQLLLPFYIACLFLWTGISIHPKRFLYGLSVAIGISALMSLYLFYIAPQIVLSTYADRREEYAAIIAWGRNFFWFNYTAVYFPWIAFITYKDKSKVALGFLYVSVILSVLGLTSLFSRTHSFAYALFAFSSIAYGAFYRSKRMVLRLCLVSAMLLGLLFLYFTLSEKSMELFGTRIVPLLSRGTSAIPASHISPRTSLYDQYLENFVHSPVLGVGLGVPFATDPVDSFYADVTIVSFGLTFGVLGLVVFGLFVYSLWRSLAKVRNEELKPIARIVIQLILVALLVSLNDNIWAYKPFVIYLAAITASIAYFGDENRARKPSQLSE